MKETNLKVFILGSYLHSIWIEHSKLSTSFRRSIHPILLSLVVNLEAMEWIIM
jgi:hypothetical protein